MSVEQKTTVTIAANKSHWYDLILNVILPAFMAGNNVLAQANIIPAPVEAGIQIGVVVASVVAGEVKQADMRSVQTQERSVQLANQPPVLPMPKVGDTVAS